MPFRKWRLLSKKKKGTNKDEKPDKYAARFATPRDELRRRFILLWFCDTSIRQGILQQQLHISLGVLDAYKKMSADG